MRFSSLHGLFHEIFFTDSVNYFDAFQLTRYYYPKKRPLFGFIKREAYTATVDISVEPDIFFSNFKKNTRYEINRAKREGIAFEIEEDIDLFFQYYNEFAKSKNLEPLLYQTLHKYREHMIITKAVKDNQVLAMHVHLYNNETAMLLYSASLFRKVSDNKLKNMIGYANRMLHYEEMLYFKKFGCKTYDFGGYGYNTEDPVEQKINHFKDSFACIPKQRYIYTSYMLELFLFGKNILQKFGYKSAKL